MNIILRSAAGPGWLGGWAGPAGPRAPAGPAAPDAPAGADAAGAGGGAGLSFEKTLSTDAMPRAQRRRLQSKAFPNHLGRLHSIIGRREVAAVPSVGSHRPRRFIGRTAGRQQQRRGNHQSNQEKFHRLFHCPPAQIKPLMAGEPRITTQQDASGITKVPALGVIAM